MLTKTDKPHYDSHQWQKTTTSPTVIVIKNKLNFFVSQAITQDIIYALTIQSVVDDKVVLSLISYASSIISQNMLSELQGLNVDQNISILGV
jgi:hypothetical protein